MSEHEFPENTPVRVRKIPRNRLPEVEVYRLGSGMAAMLQAAAWIANRGNGYTVPYCDDTGLLMRHGEGDPDDVMVWNEWFAAGALMLWTPPGPDSGLFGEVGEAYLNDYEPIAEAAGGADHD
jgi:hypothetical protein